MSDTATNPSNYYPGTSWQQTCIGRVPIGINTADYDFNEVNKSGGSKTHAHSTAAHVLTIAEMPRHLHEGIYQADNDYSIAISTYGGSVTGYSTGYADAWVKPHALKTAMSGNSNPHSHGDTGSASNQMMYQTKYFWKRIA